MFELTSTPIDSSALQVRLAAPDAGAAVIFEGRVRNHHLGRPVTRLEYEAYDDLALREGAAILDETTRLYPGTRTLCVHRTGSLQIGEIAVWIGVASAHRQAGFAACRHVIEELKRRLPVWKKEHHPDGAAEWVNCTTEARTPASTDYNARQESLPEVGTKGQARLAEAKILVIGLGGLGCPAAVYLAGAGVGRLTLIDGGRVELSNLHRQILFTTGEVGSPKAAAAAARLRLHNPSVEVIAHDVEFSAGNARALIAGQDVVLDCTDNFATRSLVHDACHALGVPLVQAAVHRFEGTLDVFRRGEGGCLHCLWLGRGPAEPETADRCEGGPVFGPAVGVLGTLQAAEAIKLLLGLEGEATRQTRLLNLLDNSQLTITRLARPDCPVCRSTSSFPHTAGSVANDPGDLLLDSQQAAVLGENARLVYLLEPGEQNPPSEKFVGIPRDDLVRLRDLAAGGPVVLACRHGLRSAALARLLRAEGMSSVYSLVGTPAHTPAVHRA
jgi:sulfur-carrier protein adenylyltransferase/sulfurtransferase